MEDLADRSGHEPVIVDGTLVTSVNHAHNPEFYSGKHRKNGHNPHIVSTLDGELLHVSEPFPGKIHDAKAARESGILEAVDKTNALAGKAYTGLGLIAPMKEYAGKPLTGDDREFNRTINSMSAAIERRIAHLKRWKTLSTRYRRPIRTLQQTIHAITSIECFKRSFR